MDNLTNETPAYDEVHLQLSSGAAITDASTGLYPYNRGVVYGPAGSRGELTVETDSGASINDSGTLVPYFLNEEGKFHFTISSTKVGSVMVTAFPQTHEPVNGVTYFNHFVQDDMYNIIYNFTTRAPADLYTVCSIYINRGSTTSNVVEARIVNSITAKFVNSLTQEGFFAFDPNGDADIDIISDTAEVVSVLLSPTGNTGTHVLIDTIEFVELPEED
ncbi:MAG: hypothetical protein ACK5NC_03405 [Vibrio sp.]